MKGMGLKMIDTCMCAESRSKFHNYSLQNMNYTVYGTSASLGMLHFIVLSLDENNKIELLTD